MTKLTDKVIRGTLKSYLAAQGPRALLEELRVHNGNAVADVVCIHDVAHCYEIKGETDEIRRISRQGSFYDLVFSKVTLVTTSNHLATAMRLAPAHWGLMVAEHAPNSLVQLRALRSAQQSSAFDKKLALLTLWKSELLSLCENPNGLQKYSRERLSTQIAEHTDAQVVSANIGTLLAKRHANNGWSFAI